MEWKEIAHDWASYETPMREQWTRLTQKEHHAIAGSRERLIGALRRLYAISQEQTEKQVTAWTKRVARAPPPAP